MLVCFPLTDAVHVSIYFLAVFIAVTAENILMGVICPIFCGGA